MGRLWPPRALTEGQAPDARFTLANERTFLAWIRTSLGLVAAAVGLEAFAPHVVPEPVRTPLVVVLLLVAATLAGYAFRRWLSVEGAMRTRRELRGTPATLVLAALIVLAGVVLAASLLVT
ncbi:putative membrane protein [Tsukamurella ocularis]|nr:putative membrane protein [Tsukamurella ocularis]MCS3787714.1 putative membrane protein [Tsukamurella ocularis]MCS3851009.1 putative membrane protein [Tsukamurella ocularis]